MVRTRSARSLLWRLATWLLGLALSNVRRLSEPFPVAAERKLYEVPASLAQIKIAA